MNSYQPWGQNVVDEYEIKNRAQQIATKMRMTPGLANQFFQTPYAALKHDNVQHLSYDLDERTLERLVNKVTAILSQRI
jgi:hypothetical protein